MPATTITAGTWRGRPLSTPPGMATRPTTSRVREALFNILREEVRGAAVVDLFAGAGTIGFEALSRAATRVTFVERDRVAADLIASTARRLGCSAQVVVIRGDVSAWLRSRPIEVSTADLCYLDAPYRDDVVEVVLDLLGGAPPRLTVCEHHRARSLAEQYGAITRTRVAGYGMTQLSFFRRERDGGKRGRTTPGREQAADE